MVVDRRTGVLVVVDRCTRVLVVVDRLTGRGCGSMYMSLRGGGLTSSSHRNGHG